MKGEINKDWYCLANSYSKCKTGESNPFWTTECDVTKCKFYHRKWPTPDQFKEEYGEEWSGAYYSLVMDDENTHWAVNNKGSIEYMKPRYVVCACTPWGKPPNDWRPE